MINYLWDKDERIYDHEDVAVSEVEEKPKIKNDTHPTQNNQFLFSEDN